MIDTDVEYRDHCDDEGCNLGALHYTCPACGKRETSYDFLQPDMMRLLLQRTEESFQCESCRRGLVVGYAEDCSCYVRLQDVPGKDPSMIERNDLSATAAVTPYKWADDESFAAWHDPAVRVTRLWEMNEFGELEVVPVALPHGTPFSFSPGC